MTEIRLDLGGFSCPQPVLRAKKAVRDLPAGAVVVLECTDPLSVIDVPHFVHRTGHVLAGEERHGGVCVFRIVKQGRA